MSANLPGSPTRPVSIFGDGRLAGLEPEALEQVATPFYVYDFDVIGAQVAALRGALPARFDVAYAVKANPALAVVAHIGSLGVGADVASGGELELVARAGIPLDRTIFTGPGKRDEELAAAVAAGVRAITVESRGELERLARAARDRSVRVPILLRLAIGRGPGEHAGGDEAGAGKFGMDPDELRSAAALASGLPELDLLGIHAFGHSNVVDADVLVDHLESTASFAADLFRGLGIPLRLVDAGGGLGIPYADDDLPLDLARLATRLAVLDRAWSADPVLRASTVVLEPGRFLVGPAGAYVTRVLDVKRVAGRTVAITDGGINHALRPALAGPVHRLRLLGRDGDAGEVSGAALVAGPLCTSLDTFGEVAAVPRPGDLVALLDVGAYGFTESMPLFLSHPMPAELAVRGGNPRTIRPRLEPATWLDGQHLPAW